MSEPHGLRELVDRLAAADVEFVLVGGLAVNAWGYLRATRDVDLVPAPDRENIERLAALLESIGGRVELADGVLGPGSVGTFLRAGDRAMVITDLGYVDVLQAHPQIPRWPELRAASREVEIGDAVVRVCSLEHLVAMKRASDRPRDHDDLEALEAGHRSDS